VRILRRASPGSIRESSPATAPSEDLGSKNGTACEVVDRWTHARRGGEEILLATKPSCRSRRLDGDDRYRQASSKPRG
jgi:hypothetical protein